MYYFFFLNPTLQSLHHIHEYLEYLYEQTQKKYSLSEKDFFSFRLVIEEVLVNILYYAFPNQSSPCIIIEFFFAFKKIRVMVKDNGFPFDPLRFTPPIFEKKLENRLIGNVGIQFVKTFSRNIQYHRKEEFNCLSFECP